MILSSIEELENDIQSNGLRAIYLILGPEMYQCGYAVRLLKSKAVSADAEAFDYSEFSAPESSVDEISEAALTFPMASKRRLVVAREIEEMPDSLQGALLDTLKNISTSTVILQAKELDHRKKFYKSLRKTECVAEFSRLKGAALERWVQTYIRRQGYQIPAAGAKKIVDLVGSDLQTLSSELEKLMLYCGNEKNISGDSVDALLRVSRQHSIFELIGAVSGRNRQGALKSLANLLSMGEHPLVVVAMLARQCRQVLIVKECLLRTRHMGEIGRAAQIPGFLLEKFIGEARAADLSAVREMYIRLADIDRKLKSSRGDGRMLLEHLICDLV